MSLPERWHRVFRSEQGLRPGWGLVLYIALFLAFFNLGRPVLRSVLHGGLWALPAGEARGLVAAILAGLVLARIEGRRFGEFGLPLRPGLSRAPWVGAAWGLAAISILVLLLRVAGVLEFGPIALSGWAILGFAMFWALNCLLVGLFEESLLRGYAQFTLARGIGFWPSALVLSAAFGALHLGNSGESWIGALSVALLGLFLCLTLRRTGNLWFAVGFHASFDWGESFLYSLPDSGQVAVGHLVGASLHGPAWLAGGTVGPEGSLICLIVTGTVSLVFTRWTRRSPRTPIHPQAPVSGDG